MSGPAHDTDDVDALFVPDGARLVPTERARGPWSPDSLHGGPVAAALARETERSTPVDDGLRMTRLTVELLRPVGTAPLTVTGAVARPGRRVQVIDTVVEQGGVEVAWGRAVRIRVDPSLVAPEPSQPEDPAPDPPDAGIEVASSLDRSRGFHNGGVGIRYVAGHFDRPKLLKHATN